MKRKPTKLTLSRETLTILKEVYMPLVAGGATLGCTVNCATASTCAVYHTQCVGY